MKPRRGEVTLILEMNPFEANPFVCNEVQRVSNPTNPFPYETHSSYVENEAQRRASNTGTNPFLQNFDEAITKGYNNPFASANSVNNPFKEDFLLNNNSNSKPFAAKDLRFKRLRLRRVYGTAFMKVLFDERDYYSQWSDDGNHHGAYQRQPIVPENDETAEPSQPQASALQSDECRTKKAAVSKEEINSQEREEDDYETVGCFRLMYSTLCKIV